MATRSYHATFEVNLPVDRTWDVMSDTQHLNQLFFGLGALQVVARDGEKARIRGSFGMLAPEYDEYPWIFEVPRHYKSVRVFTRGLLKRLETECTLTDEAGKTRVDYRVTFDAVGGPLGAVAAWEAARRTEAGISSARKLLATMGPTGIPNWPPANPQREAVLQRAHAVTARVEMADDEEKQALNKLVEHIADAAEPDVARMRPYELADAWGASRKKTLAACLRATRGGLLRLSWDLLCPSCEAPTSVGSLKDLPAAGHCPACDIDFSTSFEQNVEATFSPEPGVRAAERLVFCHGSPSSTRSWLAQFVVDDHKSHETQMVLGVGRYRLQAAGVQGNTLIDVVEANTVAPDHVTVGIDTLEGKPRLPSQVPALRAGRIKIVVDNKGDKARRVQIAHRAFASRAATAADVTETGLFKELFGGEALAPDQHVAVGMRSIMFTDLCGSTAMYERIGDAAAYGLVREHFRLLFAEVERQGGRVVKTVGDCVMAAFDTPLEAARAGRASVEALRRLRDKDGNAPGLQLKVGVHTGSCLAVEANGQVDYFGRTVNIAARVESLARPDEVVLSWSTVAFAEVRGWVKEVGEAGDVVVDDRRPVKGIDGEVEIVRVAVKP